MIARSPRLVGSPAYEQARDYILGTLSSLGLTTEVQSTTLNGKPVENILARWEGASSREAILLMAHLDSVPDSPGATDDGSGVAAVLETARALRSGPALANTVIVLFTGPEEDCCYGAKAFATEHPWAKDVRLVINLDAGGLSGPSILAATGPEEGWLIRELAWALPDPIGSSAIEALGSPKTDYTLELRKDGFMGFDFNLSWEKRIHAPSDNAANVDLASLQHQGEHLLAVARRFGNLPLDFPRLPRPIYFDLLGFMLITYPVAWAVPIFIGVMIVMGWVLFTGFRRKNLSWRGLALGIVPLILSLVTVPLILGAVQLSIYPPSQAYRPPPAWVAGLAGGSPLATFIRWAAAILAVLSTLLWYALCRRRWRVNAEELILGASTILFLVAGGTSLFFPELSYLFVWPLLFGLLSEALRLRNSGVRSGEPGWPRLLLLLASSIITIVLFVPGVLIAVLSIDITMIYLVPVFIVLMLGNLVSLLDWLFTTGR